MCDSLCTESNSTCGYVLGAEVKGQQTNRDGVEDMVLEIDMIVRTWRSKTAFEIQGKVKTRFGRGRSSKM